MKARNVFLGMAVLVLAATSCSDDKDGYENENNGAVRFNSTIVGNVQTRAAGTTWGTSDAIGVYMKKAGQELTDASVITNVANNKYTTPGSGVFSAAKASDAIYLPVDGSKADFVAYYPYKDPIDAYIYKVDVVTQTSQEAIDLLYSNDAVNQDKANSDIGLGFNHQLTKMVLNVKAGSGVANLEGLAIKISGMKTKADFALATGILTATGNAGDITIKTTVDGVGVMGEAIVLPAAAVSGRTVTFILPSGSFKWEIPATTKYELGKRYTYNVELKNTGAVVPNGTISDWMEGSSESIVVENGDDKEVGGDGTKDAPYTATQALTKSGEAGKWVEGYIVGVSTLAKSGNFTAPFTIKTNILLAASATETDYAKCFPIELVNDSEFQKSLNLVDNVTLLGKSVKVQGDITASIFGSAAGSANVTAQEGGVTTPPNPGETVTVFNETFGAELVVKPFPKIAAYTKFDNKEPIAFTDPLSTCDIRNTKTFDNHVWLKAGEANLIIAGINTTGKSELVLSYDMTGNIFAATDEVNINILKVKFDGKELAVPSVVLNKADGYGNKYYSVILDINSIATSDNSTIEFSVAAQDNTLGLRLDNIKLEGKK